VPQLLRVCGPEYRGMSSSQTPSSGSRMAAPEQGYAVAPARWDGRQVLFDIHDADRSFACAISLSALQDLSEFRRFKPADLLKCFEAIRPRIEAIALGKLRARSAEPTGLLHIWSDDLTDAPPG
jgi:hypothetical protein